MGVLMNHPEDVRQGSAARSGKIQLKTKFDDAEYKRWSKKLLAGRAGKPSNGSTGANGSGRT